MNVFFRSFTSHAAVDLKLDRTAYSARWRGAVGGQPKYLAFIVRGCATFAHRGVVTTNAPRGLARCTAMDLVSTADRVSRSTTVQRTVEMTMIRCHKIRMKSFEACDMDFTPS